MTGVRDGARKQQTFSAGSQPLRRDGIALPPTLLS